MANNMNLERLYDILNETTVQLRKGEEIEEKQIGSLQVTHVYAMPPESQVADDLKKIDCHFIIVGVDTAKAAMRKDELVDILGNYPEAERLKGGPSYIEVGGIIGDQGAAFQLFALGEVLGLWKVITPKRLGMTGEMADSLAGRGLVMISGYQTEK